jgi:hypothetical protein
MPRGVRITLDDQALNNSGGAGTITCSYSIESDGDIVGDPAGDLGDWIIPRALAGANYEVRATLNSGSLFAGTTGSWLGLGTTRTWTVQRTTPGTQDANLTIEIRPVSGSVLDSALVTLSTERT